MGGVGPPRSCRQPRKNIERNPLPKGNEWSWRSSQGDRDKSSHVGDRERPPHGARSIKPFQGGGGNRTYYGRERDKGRERRQETKTLTMMGKLPIKCVYCDSSQHKNTECDKAITIADRTKILSNKKLCFNCTRNGHPASKCTSRYKCFKCSKKHHTSLCPNKASTVKGTEEQKPTPEKTFGATTARGSTIHPSAVCTINGEDARIAIDTMSSLNYICTELVKTLRLKPIRKEKQTIEHIFGTVNRWVEIYRIEIKSKTTNEKLNIEYIKLDKAVITHLPNPSLNEENSVVSSISSHTPDPKGDGEETRQQETWLSHLLKVMFNILLISILLVLTQNCESYDTCHGVTAWNEYDTCHGVTAWNAYTRARSMRTTCQRLA